MIAALQPGDIVDRYEVLSVIGQGGMAIVLEVRHRDLGTRHALKVLQIAMPGLHARLLQEGRIQAGLEHENVCRVSDVVRVGGAPGLVMELVAGPTLDTLVANYQPSLPQIDTLARGIIAGVRAAHEAGLVHRDLKPANVLIAVRDGRVIPKVADFGLAKAVDETLDARGGATTRSGATMGTPLYMAPEQFRNAKRADHRADLFSLGCLLYELVSGIPPFRGDVPIELYAQTSSGGFRPLREVAPAIPERIERAILRALEPDPDRRWQSCDEMLDSWCHGLRDTELADAWEPAHLTLIQSLGPTQRPATSTLSFAPAALPFVPTRTIGATEVPATQARTILKAAAGLVGLGTIVAVATVLAGGLALGAFVWLRAEPAAAPVSGGVPAIPSPVIEVPPVPVPVPVPALPSPTPQPVRVAPEPVVRPEPTPEPVVLQEPVAEPPAEPPRARIRVDGVERAWLVTDAGERYKPGALPPGHYALDVFFDETRPIRTMTLDLRAGDDRIIVCQPSFKVCR